MEAKKQSPNPYKGAIFLAIASVIVKLLSAIYKVPFQNLTGDAGFYVYQQVYPFYGIAIVFSFSGLPLFISKLVSEARTLQDREQLLHEIFTLLLLLGGSTWLALQLLARPIATLMGDVQLSSIIQSVSYFYLVIPLMAVFRGVFQGSGEMIPTGVSQILEQVTRIFVILFVAFRFTEADWSIYTMGTYAMMSTVISGIVSCVVLFYFISKSTFRLRQVVGFKRPTVTLLRRFGVEGLEIILLSSMMVLFQLIDSFSVFNGLLDRGMSSPQAMVLKGMYDRGQPFVQLGLTVALSISTSLLPALTHFYQTKQLDKWLDEVKSTLRMTITWSSATTIGLISVMPWLNIALFQSADQYHVLQIYTISVFFVSVSLAIQSILQSMSFKSYTTSAIFAALFMKLALNIFGVRLLGTIGSSLVTVLATALLCVMMVLQLKRAQKNIRLKTKFKQKVLLANLMMFLVVTLVRELFTVTSRFQALIGVLGLAGLGVIIYLVLIIKLNILSTDELTELPFFSVLQKVGLL